jgi:hypothetical protein
MMTTGSCAVNFHIKRDTTPQRSIAPLLGPHEYGLCVNVMY